MDKETIINWIKNHISLYKKIKKKDLGEKKHISPIVVFVVIGAILVLFCMRGGSSRQTEQLTETENTDYSAEKEYVSRMEGDLKEILAKISGAGNVSVRIYIDSTNEKVLAEDSKKQSETNETKDGSRESSSSESQPVVSSGGTLGGSASPYVIMEKLPYPIGVVVVAEGARDDVVKNEIYEAVKALYGLSANRIKITY